MRHIHTMAALGYGCVRGDILDQACNYAVHLGKRDGNHHVSDRWYRGLMRRWPELKLVKPRPLAKYRAQATSADNISSYFNNLQATLVKHDLMNKPECIYNVDEKGVPDRAFSPPPT